jgi:ribonuclease HI
MYHLDDHHQDACQIYTDGSKDGNSVGCAVTCGDHTIKCKLSSQSSIFTAELIALLTALQFVSDSPLASFVIFVDSRSVLQAVRRYDSTHPVVSKIVRWLIRLTLQQQKVVKLCWVPSHVGIDGNEAADEAAAEAALLAVAPLNPLLPYRDYFPLIRSTVWDRWELEWQNTNGNKLRMLKDTVKPWDSSNHHMRRYSRTLCRLRIGHTMFSHGHLMEQRPPAYCQDCLVPLTVVHVMAECPSLREHRHHCFPHVRGLTVDETMRAILSEQDNPAFDTGTIMIYLHRCNLYYQV